MKRSQLVLPLALALALAACSADEPAPTPQPGAAEPTADAHDAQDLHDDAVPAAQPASVDPADSNTSVDNDTDAGFSVESVPVSGHALGAFPYLGMPEGYHHPGRPVPDNEFDQVAFWTGDRLEWVEGRVHRSLIRAERGKSFSRLELIRNVDHQVEQAGGVRVTESRVPAEIVKEWDAGQAGRTGRGDVYNHPVLTWLIRQADRNIWVGMVATNSGASWTIAETEAFVPTASLLPSSELKAQLDAQGRVAVEVNFAVDAARILPESQPQIEQIIELLTADPALRLAVEGHTDSTGAADHNQRLSEERAASVVAALTSAGIDAGRLESAGFGQGRPVADNDTEEGRARNRRVELVRLPAD